MNSPPRVTRHWLPPKLLHMVLMALLLALASHLSAAKAIDLPSELSILRQAILDRLLAMPDVAAHKWTTGKPVEDRAQEIAVIDAAIRAGAVVGLPAETVKRAISAQIEASKLIQQDLISQWQARSAPRTDDIPDLNSTLRPRIARATTTLIEGLAAAGPHLRNCNTAAAMRAQPEAIVAFPRAWDKAVDGVIAAVGGPDRSVCR